MSDASTWWSNWTSNLQSLQHSIDRHRQARPDPDSTWTTVNYKSFQSLHKSRISALEDALKRHRGEEAAVEALGRRLRNQTSLIGQMPSEILLMSFALAVATKRTSPEALMRVCHRWRALLRGDHASRLWSRVVIEDVGSGNKGFIRSLLMHLELSRSHPLDIHIVADDEGSLRALDSIILPLFEQHYPRVHTMSISLGPPGYSPPELSLFPLPPSLSSLQSLVVSGFVSTVLQESPLVDGPLPHLTRLQLLPEEGELANIEDMLPNPTYLTHLTHLCIVYDPLEVDYEVLWHTLSQLKNLTVLDFTNNAEEAPDQGMEALVSFESLQRLTIRGIQSVPVFRKLAAHVLTDAYILAHPGTLERRIVEGTLHSWSFNAAKRLPMLRVVVLHAIEAFDASELPVEALFGLETLEEMELRLPFAKCDHNMRWPLGNFSLSLDEFIANLIRQKPQYRLRRLHIAPSYGHQSHITRPNKAKNLILHLQSFLDAQAAFLAPGRAPIQLTLDHSLVKLSDELAEFIKSEPLVSADSSIERVEDWSSYTVR